MHRVVPCGMCVACLTHSVCGSAGTQQTTRQPAIDGVVSVY